MTRLQEYSYRMLLTVVGSFFATPIAALIILLLTGAHGSRHFAEGIYALTAIVLFFIPITKTGAKVLAEGSTAETDQRKADEKEHAERMKQLREQAVARRNTKANS